MIRCFVRAGLSACLLFGMSLGAIAAEEYPLSGRVVKVADGDTITLLVERTRERIRLANIDAPETGHGRKRPGQPFGKASREALAALVAGKTLTLQCYERDRYGRHICDIPLEGGETANRRMVALGMAWANQQNHGKYLRDSTLLAVQREARVRHLGVWQREDAVAPWVWRRECWRALESGRSSPIC